MLENLFSENQRIALLKIMLENAYFRLPRPVKSRLYNPIFYSQGKQKNILMFSSRRGGSTLLEQIICCNRGFRSIDQPFDLFFPQSATGKIKAKYLPKMTWSQFISLSATEEEQVIRYMTLTLSGQLRLLGGIEQWDFPVLGHRTFMKILNASALIDWFATTFDVYIVYLVRHPIPQALSVMNNNWGITASAYLDNQLFVKNYLSQEQLDFGQSILQNGNYFQQAILNWVLENLVPLKYANANFLKVNYEDLIIDPTKIVFSLCNENDLKDTDRMIKQVHMPSRSTKFSEASSKKSFKDPNPESRVSSWITKVTESQKKDVDEILSAFGIFEYSSDSPISTKNRILI
jgi:Sulfotransferase domain